MVSAHAGVEAVLVVVGVGVYVFYHVWILKLKQIFRNDPYWHDYFAAGKMARMLWAQACLKSSAHGILAVQTIRNAVMAVTFLATIQGILFSICISLVFDQPKINRINRLIETDPIAGNVSGAPLLPGTAVLAVSIAVLFTSFVCLTQANRLYVHLSFMITAVSSQLEEEQVLSKEEATTMAVRAGVSFSLGLRIFYLYIIVLAWCVGPTYVMICGLLMTLILHHLDKFKPKGLMAAKAKAEDAATIDAVQPQDAPKLMHSGSDVTIAHLV